MRKTGIIVLILFLSTLFWATGSTPQGNTQYHVEQNKLTVVMADDDRNPYLYNPQIKELQVKLNQVLSFNFEHYTNIRVSGFWNDETQAALEQFRAMYYKKYQLQRYYAFSAGEIPDTTTALANLNGEVNFDSSLPPVMNPVNMGTMDVDVQHFEQMGLGYIMGQLENMPLIQRDLVFSRLQNSGQFQNMIRGMGGSTKEVFKVDTSRLLSGMNTLFSGQLGMAADLSVDDNAGLWARTSVSLMANASLSLLGELPLERHTVMLQKSPILGAEYTLNAGAEALNPAFYLPIFGEAISGAFKWLKRGMEENAFSSIFSENDYTWGGRSYFDSIYKDRENKVELSSGNYSRVEVDYYTRLGTMNLDLLRFYSSQSYYKGAFGRGWNLGYNYKVLWSQERNILRVMDGSGFNQDFEEVNGIFVPKGTDKSSGYYRTIEIVRGSYGQAGSEIRVTTTDKVMLFKLFTAGTDNLFVSYKLTSMTDRYGFSKTMTYTDALLSLVTVKNPGGESLGNIQFLYNDDKLIKEARVSVGGDVVKTLSYTYNTNQGSLLEVAYGDEQRLSYQYEQTGMKEAYERIKEAAAGLDMEAVYSYFRYQDKTQDIQQYIPDDAFIEEQITKYKAEREDMFFAIYKQIVDSTQLRMKMLFGYRPHKNASPYWLDYDGQAAVPHYKMVSNPEGQTYEWQNNRAYENGNLLDTGTITYGTYDEIENGSDPYISAVRYARIMEYVYQLAQGKTSGTGFSYKDQIEKFYERAGFVPYNNREAVLSELDKPFPRIVSAKPGSSHSGETKYKDAAAPVLATIAYFNSQVSLIEQYYQIPVEDDNLQKAGKTVKDQLTAYVSGNYLLSLTPRKSLEESEQALADFLINHGQGYDPTLLFVVLEQLYREEKLKEMKKYIAKVQEEFGIMIEFSKQDFAAIQKGLSLTQDQFNSQSAGRHTLAASARIEAPDSLYSRYVESLDSVKTKFDSNIAEIQKNLDVVEDIEALALNKIAEPYREITLDYAYSERDYNADEILQNLEKFTKDAKNNESYKIQSLSVNGNVKSFEYYDSYSVYKNSLGQAYQLHYDTKRNLSSLVYPDSTQLTLEYDGYGRVVKEINPAGRITSMGYDVSGRLTAKTLPDGRVWTFSYDNDTAGHLKRPTTITRPDGSVISMSYNDEGDLTSRKLGSSVLYSAFYDYQDTGYSKTETDLFGYTTLSEYDNNYQLKKIRYPDGGTYSYQCDAQGHRLRETWPGGTEVTRVYDLEGQQISETKKTDVYGEATRSWTYDAYGNVLSSKDPLGNPTSYQYDYTHKKVFRTTQADGSFQQNVYDSEGRVTTNVNSDGKGMMYTYNVKGQVTDIHTTDGVHTLNTYSADGLLQRETITGRGLDDATLQQQGWDNTVSDKSYVYDNAGRIVEELDHIAGIKTITAYNSLDQIESESIVKDTDYVKRDYRYDGLGRLIRVDKTIPGQTVVYQSRVYNDTEHSYTVTDALGRETVYTLDFRNKVVHKQYALTLKIGDNPIVQSTEHIYNALGQLIQSSYPDGTVKKYEYGGGLLVKEYRRSKNPAAYKEYSYDRNGNLIGTTDYEGNRFYLEYNNVNRVTKKTDETGAYTLYEYDAAGNRNAITTGELGTIRYTHNLAGQITQITYSDGVVIQKGYDALGNLSIVKKASGSELYHHTAQGLTKSVPPAGASTVYSYNLENRRIQAVTGERSYGFAYDILGRLIEKTFPRGEVENTGYSLDNGLLNKETSIGRFKQSVLLNQQGWKLQSRVQDPQSPREENFTYNASGQVTEHSTYKGKTLYTYNDEGLVQSITDPLGRTKTTMYNRNGQQTEVKDFDNNTYNYSYDKAGRLQSETYPDYSRTVYSYNTAGKVESKSFNQRATSYTYNSRGEVASETGPLGGTTVLTYDNNGWLIQYSQAGGTYSFDYYADGKVKNQKSPKGFVTSYVYNPYREVEKAILPDSTEISLSYDNNGKVISRNEAGYNTAYQYTTEGYVEKVIYPNGSGMAYEYNPSGSVTKSQWREQDPSAASSPRMTEYQYYPDGNLKQSIDYTGISRYLEYDALGRAVLQKETAGGQERSTHLNYETQSYGNTSLNVTTRWLNDGSSKEYNWTQQAQDFRGNTHWIKQKINGSIVKIREQEYNIYGQPKYLIRHQDASQSARTDYSYDEKGTLTGVALPTGLSASYSYDAWGRITGKTEGDRTSQYEYDAESQLKKIINPLNQITELTYDYQGNVIRSSDETRKLVQESHYDYRGLTLWTKNTWDGKNIVEKYAYDWNGQLVSHTNSLGGVTSYSYDGFGQVLSKSRPQTDGTLSTYEYNAKGQLYKEISINGEQTYDTIYDYDAWGQVQTINYPDGSQEKASYNSLGVPIQTIDRYGYAQKYHYDDNLRLAENTSHNPGGELKTKLTYDWDGNVTLQEINQRRTQYIYDNNSRIIEEKVYTSTGSISRHFSYDSYNNIQTESDYMGNITRAEYDKLNRPIKTIDPLNQVRDIVYNDDLLKVTEIHGDHSTQSFYDGFGNLIRQIDAMGHETKVKYNNAHQPKEIQNALGYKNFIHYDTYNRVVAEIDPYGKADRYEYDALDNVTKSIDKEGYATQYTHDWQGRPVQVTDALGNISKASYHTDADKHYEKVTSINAKGNTTLQYMYNDQILQQTDALGHTTHYYYDAYSQLSKITDALGSSSTLKYDLRGNVTEKKSSLGHTTSYEYNANSQVIKEINALNNISSHYDKLGRLTAKVYSDGNRKDFTYDIHDRITKASDRDSAYTYQYDQNDNVLAKIDTKNNSAVYYKYDVLGQRTNMQSPGLTQSYQYDANGQLIYTEARNAKEKISIAYHYNVDGTLEHKEFSTGLKTAYQYDALNQVTQIDNLTNNKALSSYTYSYDNIGNRIKEIETLNSKTITKSFQYDKLSRLTYADYGNNEYERFTYNPTGNRIRKITQEGTTSYTYDSDNKLLSEQFNGINTRYTYDQNGRLILKQKGTTREQFTYDARDLMTQYRKTEGTSINQTVYKYDVLNQRTSKTTGIETTKFTYDGDNILSENDTYLVNNLQINGYEGKLSQFNRTIYIKDPLGSVVGELSKNSISMKQYQAFGSYTDTEDKKQGVGYTGHYYDNESGLYYARNRYYDPGVGRFTERDLIEEYHPDGLNKYMYASNNPIRYWDAYGLMYGESGDSSRSDWYQTHSVMENPFYFNTTSTPTWGSVTQPQTVTPTYNNVTSPNTLTQIPSFSERNDFNDQVINRLNNMTSIGPDNFDYSQYDFDKFDFQMPSFDFDFSFDDESMNYNLDVDKYAINIDQNEDSIYRDYLENQWIQHTIEEENYKKNPNTISPEKLGLAVLFGLPEDVAFEDKKKYDGKNFFEKSSQKRLEAGLLVITGIWMNRLEKKNEQKAALLEKKMSENENVIREVNGWILYDIGYGPGEKRPHSEEAHKTMDELKKKQAKNKHTVYSVNPYKNKIETLYKPIVRTIGVTGSVTIPAISGSFNAGIAWDQDEWRFFVGGSGIVMGASPFGRGIIQNQEWGAVSLMLEYGRYPHMKEVTSLRGGFTEIGGGSSIARPIASKGLSGEINLVETATGWGQTYAIGLGYGAMNEAHVRYGTTLLGKKHDRKK